MVWSASMSHTSAIDLGYPHDFLIAGDAMITGNTIVHPPPQERLV